MIIVKFNGSRVNRIKVIVTVTMLSTFSKLKPRNGLVLGKNIGQEGFALNNYADNSSMHGLLLNPTMSNTF